ncbi:MAG TPA: NfeD family protein [Thermoclostridium sp.]|nr:NfeD family protein [Thermoclostridium sp.]
MGIFSFLDGMQIYQAIILVVGLVLLVIEMFTPGLGVSGGLGLVLLVVGIILTASTPFEALVMVVILLVIIGVALAVVLQSAAKGRLSKTLVLNKTLDKQSGYTGNDDLEHFVGKEGITLTALRPAGTADFDGVRLDVVSEGGYISRDTKIKVIEVAGRRIVVRVV